MRSSLEGLLLMACAVGAVAGVESTARAENWPAELRFMSSAVRDRLPTADEARELAGATDKDAKLSALVDGWLDSSEHAERVRRHFNDMFGSTPYLFLTDEQFNLTAYDGNATEDTPPDLTEVGAFYLPIGVKPSCGAVRTASAWWADAPIRICSSAVSAVLDPPGRSCTDSTGADGIRHPDCGCGPMQLLCFAAPLKRRTMASVAREFPDRALYAYEQGLGWDELFGGEHLYADRFLYYWYLYTERIAVKEEVPTSAELALLASLPVDGSRKWVSLPVGGPERGGVATMPAFMMRFNNFRSRVRALTERLLCKDIDPSLNTSGIAELVNQDLSDFDKEHGTKEQCSGCHYALDNFGSTLLGWDDSGYYQAWWSPSQRGHVFGEEGEGPRFLVGGYVERAPGFTECMAKKTWEGFSGLPWDALKPEDQEAFVKVAPEGPRALVRAVLESPTMLTLRLDRKVTITKTVAGEYAWGRDVEPVVTASCSGSACHGADSLRGPATAYAGSEERFRTVQVDRLTSGSMPPPGSGRELSDADRAMLVSFLTR
jgi:hypothetical protein